MALHGALAASSTPLRDHGSGVDEEAFGPLVDFYVRERLDGVLALGTAGIDLLRAPISSYTLGTDLRNGKPALGICQVGRTFLPITMMPDFP